MLRDKAIVDPTQRYQPKVGKSGAFDDQSNPRLTDAALVGLTRGGSIYRLASYFRCAAWDADWRHGWPAPEVGDRSDSMSMGDAYRDPKDAVDITPMPSSLRAQILGSGKRWSRPQTWAMVLLYAVRVAAVAAGLYSATMLQGEAVLIRDYGVTVDAMERDVLGYAYNGWTWLQTSYLVTALVSLVEVCIGMIFVWGGVSAMGGGVPIEVRNWFAASPELEFMPFGVRQIGFFFGDLIFCIGLYATREQLFQQDAYNLNPSYVCLDSTTPQADGSPTLHAFDQDGQFGWPGMFRFYRERMKNTRVSQYLMLIGVSIRLGTIVLDALMWSGLNVCYILPWARYNTEIFAKRTPADNAEARWEQDKMISISYTSIQKAYRSICQLYEASASMIDGDAVDPEMYNVVNTELIRWSQGIETLHTQSSQLFGEDEHNAPEDLQLIESLQMALNEGIIGVPAQIVPTNGAPTAADLNAQTQQLMELLAPKLRQIGRMIPDRIQISTLYSGPKIMYSGVALRQECAFGGQPCCGAGASRVCGSCATLSHNYWGALRMWTNVGSLLLFFWVFANASTGIWNGLLSSQKHDNDMTWPVYVASSDFNATLDHPFLIVRLPTYYPPPPPTLPPSSLGLLGGATADSPPSPLAPPPSPSSSPPPPMKDVFPPKTCMENLKSLASARSGVVAPYPEGLSEDDNAATRMLNAATLLILAEFFRTVGTLAQAVGVLRNEASFPGSHTRRSRKATETCRSLCP